MLDGMDDELAAFCITKCAMAVEMSGGRLLTADDFRGVVQEAARVAVAEAEGPLKKQAVRWAKRDDTRAGLLEEPTATLRLRWGNGKPARHLGERVIAYDLRAV